MKYFFDTEFIEDGKTIDLISIGITTLSGREFYRCNQEARLDLASPWVRQNVLVHLPSYSDPAWCTRAKIRDDLLTFVDDQAPEFWAYYADYDWVALCQLFGTMMDLPPRFPRWCRDLKQLSVLAGSPTHPPQPTDAHNALADARWNVELYQMLVGHLKALKDAP